MDQYNRSQRMKDQLDRKKQFDRIDDDQIDDDRIDNDRIDDDENRSKRSKTAEECTYQCSERYQFDRSLPTDESADRFVDRHRLNRNKSIEASADRFTHRNLSDRNESLEESVDRATEEHRFDRNKLTEESADRSHRIDPRRRSSPSEDRLHRSSPSVDRPSPSEDRLHRSSQSGDNKYHRLGPANGNERRHFLNQSNNRNNQSNDRENRHKKRNERRTIDNNINTTTVQTEASRQTRNRTCTLKQRARNYLTEIIRRGIDSRFSVKIVKEILRRYDVPYKTINISRSSITGRTSLYIGLRIPSKVREYEARTPELFTTEYFNEFRARNHC